MGVNGPSLHWCSDVLGGPVIPQKLSRSLVSRKGTNVSKGVKCSQPKLCEVGSHHETSSWEFLAKVDYGKWCSGPDSLGKSVA